MPSNEDEDEKPYLRTETEDIKLAADYARLSFNEVIELDCFTYRIILRDALIFKLRQSQEGQEYLENCWILTQTNPDKNTLRKQFGKDGRKNNL